MHFPRTLRLPAGADGRHGRLHVERRRLVAEPRILPFGELAGAREDLLPVISLPVADRQRGRPRPHGVARMERALFLLEPRAEHRVQPRGDARAHGLARDPDDGIGGRRLLPASVEAAQERREVEPRAADDDDRHVRRHRRGPGRRRAQPGARGELVRRGHDIHAAHVELRALRRRGLRRADVHARVDEHRVGAQDPRAHLARERRGDRALAARRRSRQKIGRARGHASALAALALGRNDRMTSSPAAVQM